MVYGIVALSLTFLAHYGGLISWRRWSLPAWPATPLPRPCRSAIPANSLQLSVRVGHPARGRSCDGDRPSDRCHRGTHTRHLPADDHACDCRQLLFFRAGERRVSSTATRNPQRSGPDPLRHSPSGRRSSSISLRSPPPFSSSRWFSTSAAPVRPRSAGNSRQSEARRPRSATTWPCTGSLPSALRAS